MRSFTHIAKLVRERRLNHPAKYSQGDLSKLLGYKNGQFISNIERAVCGLPVKVLQPLCEILNIDKSDLQKALLQDYRITLESVMDSDRSSVL